VATHHPGEAVARMADVLVVNKVDTASTTDVAALEAELRAVNPTAAMVRAASPIVLEDAAAVSGRRTLVVEDGPTITHGGMAYGAGYLAAVAAGAEVVDPRQWASAGSRAVFAAYPHIGRVLPAVGYDAAQLAALKATIDAAEIDVVVSATPVDLARLLRLDRPVVRARYEFADVAAEGLAAIVDRFAASVAGGRGGR
jgi:predicted GTPase